MSENSSVEEQMNAIAENAYDIVIAAAGEVIKEFNGEELVGKEKLADFNAAMLTRLNSPENKLNENQVTAIVTVLMQGKPLANFTGTHFSNLISVCSSVTNIEYVKNRLNMVIGIKERL